MQHTGPIPTYRRRIPVFSSFILNQPEEIFQDLIFFPHLYSSSPNPNLELQWTPTLAQLTVEFGFSRQI
jgi:hypothetical protein